MNDILELFEIWVLNIQRENMSKDKRYCALAEQKAQALRAFCAAYPTQAQYDCLDLLDLQYALSEDEKFFLFRFGFRLGMELGRLRF